MDCFLDAFSSKQGDGEQAIINLIAKHILGTEQQHLLQLRYADMRKNYNNVTAAYIKNFPKGTKEYEFSESLTPFSRSANRYYSDTTAVPIPITHDFFSKVRSEIIRKKSLDGVVVGLDVPTWFNLQSEKRIMIVAQDPLRNPKWYHECEKAICSSPFGLHDRAWRNNGRGGKRLSILIQTLIQSGFGVYLTDAYKYYFAGWKQDKNSTDLTKGERIDISLKESTNFIKRYGEILREEIEIVNPSCIVTFGLAAKKAIRDILPGKNIISLPHFSGANQGSYIQSDFYKDAKKHLCLPECNDIETQAKVFAYAINNNIKLI